MKLPRSFSILALSGLLSACGYLPVTPWVSFTSYQDPQFDPAEFKTDLQAWEAGQAMTWQIRFRGSTFANQEVVIASTGAGSLGPVTAASGQKTTTFTPTHEALTGMLDRIMASGVFDLYDGHYGAYLQGGGSGGPELTITVSDLLKHVSKDDNLSSGISHEAGAIEAASNAVADVALPFLSQ